MDTAGVLKEITGSLGIPFIYKSSYDKANRSSGKSYRGLGMDKGLEILAEVRKQVGVAVLTEAEPTMAPARISQTSARPEPLCSPKGSTTPRLSSSDKT